MVFGESIQAREPGWKIFGRRCLVVLLSFANPALMLHRYETLRAEINLLARRPLSQPDVVLILGRLARLRQVDTVYTAFLR